MRGTRKIFQERAAGDAEERRGSFDLTFSWPVLGLMALFLIGVIAWAFFMGVMVGQGQNPHTKIRELTGFSLTTGTKPGDAASTPGDVGETSAQMDTELAKGPEQPASTEKADTSSFRKPQGQELEAWGEKPAATPAPAKAEKKKDKAPVREELFDYSFQIAAFKTLEEAKNLQKRLNAIPVKTAIRKSGKVELLIASLRGNSSAPEELRKKLVPLKLGKPLQLSKTPVASRTKRSK